MRVALRSALLLLPALLPASAAAAPPITDVSVTQAAAPGGWATVRVVLQAPDVDSSVSVMVTPSTVPAVFASMGGSYGGAAYVRSLRLDGPGTPAWDLPGTQVTDAFTDASVPVSRSCARAGYTASPWNPTGAAGIDLVVPAGQQTAVVAGIELPPGFETVDPVLGVSASSYSAVRPEYVHGIEHTPMGTPVFVPLTRAATPVDAVQLIASARRKGRTHVTGSVWPGRADATIEFVGRKFRANQSMPVLVPEASALQPVGARLRRYGSTTTDANGHFDTWVTTPPRATLVARTTGIPGRTTGGASCPVAPLDVPATATPKTKPAKKKR